MFVNKIPIIFAVVIILSLYFVVTIFILPENFITKSQSKPIPEVSVTLSDSEINIGDSFTVKANVKNIGEIADIMTLSTSFPSITEINDTIKIVSYDFTQSPQYVQIGDELGARYTGGVETIIAEYPSIEAFSRPVAPGIEYTMELKITPENLGEYIFYIKSVGIPHSSNDSHYPSEGLLDHQEEYVQPFSVLVKP